MGDVGDAASLVLGVDDEALHALPGRRHAEHDVELVASSLGQRALQTDLLVAGPHELVAGGHDVTALLDHALELQALVVSPRRRQHRVDGVLHSWLQRQLLVVRQRHACAEVHLDRRHVHVVADLVRARHADVLEAFERAGERESGLEELARPLGAVLAHQSHLLVVPAEGADHVERLGRHLVARFDLHGSEALQRRLDVTDDLMFVPASAQHAVQRDLDHHVVHVTFHRQQTAVSLGSELELDVALAGYVVSHHREGHLDGGVSTDHLLHAGGQVDLHHLARVVLELGVQHGRRLGETQAVLELVLGVHVVVGVPHQLVIALDHAAVVLVVLHERHVTRRQVEVEVDAVGVLRRVAAAHHGQLVGVHLAVDVQLALDQQVAEVGADLKLGRDVLHVGHLNGGRHLPHLGDLDGRVGLDDVVGRQLQLRLVRVLLAGRHLVNFLVQLDVAAWIVQHHLAADLHQAVDHLAPEVDLDATFLARRQLDERLAVEQVLVVLVVDQVVVVQLLRARAHTVTSHTRTHTHSYGVHCLIETEKHALLITCTCSSSTI